MTSTLDKLKKHFPDQSKSVLEPEDNKSDENSNSDNKSDDKSNSGE